MADFAPNPLPSSPDLGIPPGGPDNATENLPGPDAQVSSSDAGGEDGKYEPDDPNNPELSTAESKAAVARARERFAYGMSTDSENRSNQLDDTKFAWERWAQWDTNNRRQREMAKPTPRPVLEFNQTGPFIKRIVNDQRKNQPTIKVRANGGGATADTAKIYSGLIRGIEQDSNAPAAYDTGLEHAVTGGRGYWRIFTDWETEDSFNQVLKVGALSNPQNVLLDPDAKNPDKSDIQWGFVLDWIDKITYEEEWPNAGQAVSWEPAPGPEQDQWASWFDADKVCVADYFEVCYYDDELVALSDGRTMWRLAYQDEVSQNADAWRTQQMQQGMPGTVMMPPLPPQIMKQQTRKRKRVDWYKVTARDTPLAKYEWLGKYVPIVCCVGDEINIAGKHVYQGVVRRLRDAQMMYNYAYTLMVERVALAPKAPFMALKGQVEGIPQWNTLNTENHPVLEYNAVTTPAGQEVSTPPTRSESIGVDQGLVTILQLCSDNLRAITGQRDEQQPNPETPWRALVQSARQGDLATFHYGDNLARAIGLTGTIMIDLIPKIWDRQRAVRMIGIDGKQTETTVNQQMPGMGPGAPPQVMNDLSLGRYDAAVETGPSYATRRLEAASEINEFMTTLGPQTAPLVADLFAEVSDWPGDVGDRVARRLKATLPPQVLAADQPGDPQVQALQAQMQQMQSQFQQAMSMAQGQIQQLTNENAMLKVKVQSKQLDFLGTLAEVNSKSDDANTTRLMAAENNASQEFIEKLKSATDIGTALAKMGYDPMSLMPQIFAMVSAGGQGMRRGPDFGDVANALQAATQQGDQQIMGLFNQADMMAAPPSTTPSMPPPSGPPSGPSGPPDGSMPPNGGGPPPDQGGPPPDQSQGGQ